MCVFIEMLQFCLCDFFVLNCYLIRTELSGRDGYINLISLVLLYLFALVVSLSFHSVTLKTFLVTGRHQRIKLLHTPGPPTQVLSLISAD